tara:strand:- start:786 stop:1796 length:1011 start_codon:yes stop_codon:yes gene_type:complete
MPIERSILNETGLSNAIDGWQSIAFWFGISAAIATSVAALLGIGFVVARNQVENVIPKKAEALLQERRAVLVEQPESTWPDWFLAEQGWLNVEPEDGIKVFVLRPDKKSAEPQTTGIILKRGTQTLVWANAITLGDQYVWPYAQDKSDLEDGENTIPIGKAIAGTGITQIIRKSEKAQIDIIGVGLESSHGGDPKDEFRELSDSRGQQLISAAEQVIEIPLPSRKINYRTLGLGRALTLEEKGSVAERRQRSALIVVIARMSHDTLMLPLGEAITKLVMDVDIGTVELSNYEYSRVASRRLSVPIVDDSELDTWSAPKINVEEALSHRPCGVSEKQ